MNVWEKLKNGEPLRLEEKREICNGLMSTEKRMEELILKYFTTEDFREIEKRRIGTGLIGGKACGVLAARKLIEQKLPEYDTVMLPHHSWFIGSGVFYEYLKENDCLELRERQRIEKEKFGETDELRRRMRNGTIPGEIEDELKKLLEYYGETPIIVRSSSLLEDGYGNAFSGKYESIFCMNQGSEKERLEELKDAVRRVYASTLNPSALEYRRKWKLLGADEQMALLVQRVEGRAYGAYYLPAASGMGCSYNPYKWMEHMNPDAGMLRLVVGLGTRAVERTPGDYPRLVCLDRAQASFYTTVADRHKFSQRQVDVLNLHTKAMESRGLEEVIPLLKEKQKRMVLSRDVDAENMLAQRGQYRKIYFADCGGLTAQNEFIHMMRSILKMLEKAYMRPVDIEFALDIQEDGLVRVNLYQCRPLQMNASEQIQIPEGVDDEILFDVRRTSMRRSKRETLDVIVWVDPQKYYDYPYAKKPDVGRMIGRINQYYEEQEKKLMLLVPGRIGTSSPELGVPVVYADISQFSAICEVAYSKTGYRPDLSYGSHMFQDLVEADVYYGAINENSKTRLYQPELLTQFPEVFSDIWQGEEELGEIIKVYDMSGCTAQLLLDAKEGRAVCQLKK